VQAATVSPKDLSAKKVERPKAAKKVERAKPKQLRQQKSSRKQVYTKTHHLTGGRPVQPAARSATSVPTVPTKTLRQSTATVGPEKLALGASAINVPEISRQRLSFTLFQATARLILFKSASTFASCDLAGVRVRPSNVDCLGVGSWHGLSLMPCDKATASRALRELEDAGFIETMRLGTLRVGPPRQ
jgi:hypothetical protein